MAASVLLLGNEINIYDNVKTSRHLVSGPIPFDAYQSGGAGQFNYGDCYGGAGNSNRVLSMRWISADQGTTYNKLLVGLESVNSAGNQTTNANGLYIFDIGQTASNAPVSPNGCTGTYYNYLGAIQPFPKQSGFQYLAPGAPAPTGARPLAAAFKP